MTLDELLNKIDMDDLQSNAESIHDDLNNADSCETISDLETNLNNAYADALRLVSDLQYTLGIIAKDQS
jgi:regulator of sirC expression with transglutaminase-like and TPR domain